MSNLTPAVVGLAGTVVGWCIAITQAAAVQDRDYARRQIGAARVLHAEVQRLSAQFMSARLENRYGQIQRPRWDVPTVHPWVEGLIAPFGASYPDVVEAFIALQAQLTEVSRGHRWVHEHSLQARTAQSVRRAGGTPSESDEAAERAFHDQLDELKAAEYGATEGLNYLSKRLEALAGQQVPGILGLLFPTVPSMLSALRPPKNAAEASWMLRHSPLE